MLVEFDTVRSSMKEAYEIDQKAEISGASSVPFETEDDYITQVTIELDSIESFTGGKTWFNDIEKDCVYALYEGGLSTTNLLITYDSFKKVYENTKGIKILRHEEL